jgi:hypothetical protein
MPPAKQSAPKDEVVVAPSLSEVADALLRAAVEASRQHERVGRLLTKGWLDDELKHVAQMCDAAVGHLTVCAETYETAAAQGKGTLEETLWHTANSLWHASRDTARRHDLRATLVKRLGKHTPEQLQQVQVEFELQASSLLAMRQAIATYRKLRPDAQ